MVNKDVYNPLMGTLKTRSKGLTAIRWLVHLAVDGWVYIWYSKDGPGRAAAPPSSPLPAVPNVTARPSTASVPTSFYSMWHYELNWTLLENSSHEAKERWKQDTIIK